MIHEIAAAWMINGWLTVLFGSYQRNHGVTGVGFFILIASIVAICV